jgi:phosphatidylglycerophosphatase A
MPPDAPAPPRVDARRWLAIVFGAGLAPVAPGTFGSLPGVALAWGLVEAGGQAALLAGLVVVVVVGTWAAHGTARRLGVKDPGVIVVDEVAGQMLTLVWVVPTAGTLAAAFFLFRVFDVLKPPPARQLEALPGGFGIMADDLAAAVYANLVLQAGVAWLPPLVGAS